jgi:hypothetical protein
MAIFRKNLSLVPIVSQILPLTDALASRRGSYYWYSGHRLYTQQSYHGVIKYIFTQMLKHWKTSTCLGPMSPSSGNTTELFRIVFWDVLPCKITVETIIPDDGGSTYLWNVSRQLFYTAVHPRRQFWTSYSPPWEHEISHYWIMFAVLLFATSNMRDILKVKLSQIIH